MSWIERCVSMPGGRDQLSLNSLGQCPTFDHAFYVGQDGEIVFEILMKKSGFSPRRVSIFPAARNDPLTVGSAG